MRDTDWIQISGASPVQMMSTAQQGMKQLHAPSVLKEKESLVERELKTVIANGVSC